MKGQLNDKARLNHIIDAIIWEIITSDLPVFKKNIVELISHLS
ncbi:unnamed protein product [marine sediment metagenome]|uniref:Uncharacterized protein n=1 Tax=marine sediment metagenome TaxID=412755 RepID=X1DNA1_9ZZZZ